MDYEALAKQYGGSVAEAPKVDYDTLAKKFGGSVEKAPEPEQSLARDIGVASRALTPYAAAAATGAGLGMLAGPAAPLAVPLGAGAGLLAMGLTDLGVAGYNALARQFGSQTQVPTYTEAVQNVMAKGGMGVEPATPRERMIAAAATGAGAGLSVPTAARTVAPMLTSPVARGVAETLSQSPVLQTVGGVTGALAPQSLIEYTDVRNPIALTAAGLVGGAVPAGAIGLKDLIARGMFAGSNRLATIMDPKATALVEAAEGRGPQIVEALRTAPEFVPGSQPTTAQASAEANAPRFTAFAKQAEQVLPAEYYDIAMAQRAARPAAIENVTPQPAAPFKTLEAARDTQAKAMFGPAFKKVVQEDEALTELFKTPAMKDVLRVAQEISANRREPFQIGETRSAKLVESPVIGPDGAPVVTEIPAKFAKFPVKNMYTVKKAMDDLIADPATFGIGAEQVNAIRGVRADFMSWLENKAPEIREARGAYRVASTPINQRDTLNTVKDKLTSALSEEAPQKAASFAEALRNAPATIKKATGETRFKSLDEYMSPQQVTMLDNIRLDLARDAKVQELVKRGGGVEPGIQQMVSKGEAGLPSVQLLNRVATIVQNISKRYQGQLDDKMAKELALQLRDPQVAAQRLEEALARQANLAAKKPPARTPIPSAVVGAPGIVNVFANRENRNAMAR